MDSITKALGRKLAVDTDQITAKARQRLAVEATNLNQYTYAGAQAQIMTTAIYDLIGLLYTLDPDGDPMYYRKGTGQILIQLPWGKAGHRLYDLRSWEANLLRGILLNRCQNPAAKIELFDYNDTSKRWHIRVDAYKTRAAAVAWLKDYGPSIQEWKTARDAHYAKEATRRNK